MRFRTPDLDLWINSRLSPWTFASRCPHALFLYERGRLDHATPFVLLPFLTLSVLFTLRWVVADRLSVNG